MKLWFTACNEKASLVFFAGVVMQAATKARFRAEKAADGASLVCVWRGSVLPSENPGCAVKLLVMFLNKSKVYHDHAQFITLFFMQLIMEKFETQL